MASTAQEEIERAFASAGWKIAEHSSPYLTIGDAQEFSLSILAYGAMIRTEDSFFKLADRERGMTYWVRVLPTPRIAAVLI